ncbi:desulfoferrodoxin family protein [Treponema pectinovorum]|uniref:desulfoferrodoxin family protein n=1 Tax=Treponema pectinovorum TaxID=164 RepID=UPI0011C8B318|nr:desulfoferrodoxin family protein [Treponema pectinovorum]
MEIKFFKCKKCGKVIALLNSANTPSVCCGEEMSLLKAGATDGAVEKHVPVASVSGNKVEVTVGSVLHPMEEIHFIEWIGIVDSEGFRVKTLKAGEAPKASFTVGNPEENFEVYAYCNLHGLWSAKK